LPLVRSFNARPTAISAAAAKKTLSGSKPRRPCWKPRNRNLGEPDYNIYTREQHAIGYAFEHRYNESLTLRQSRRHIITL